MAPKRQLVEPLPDFELADQVTQAEWQPQIYTPALDSYYLKMLIYGPAGVGKTTLAATADICRHTAPALFLNAEGGMLSVADARVIGLEQPPKTIDVPTFAELERVYWWIARQGDSFPFKTVVIDTLDEIQLMNLDAIVTNRMVRTSKSGSVRESIDDLWQEDYGRSAKQIRRVLRQFRDLPLHVIWVCHSASTFDKTKAETVHPNLTPKVRSVVTMYMDVVAFMYQDTGTGEGEQALAEPVRRLLCRPYGKWVAKDRSPGQRLGLTMDDPTIDKIMARILQEEEEE